MENFQTKKEEQFSQNHSQQKATYHPLPVQAAALPTHILTPAETASPQIACKKKRPTVSSNTTCPWQEWGCGG